VVIAIQLVILGILLPSRLGPLRNILEFLQILELRLELIIIFLQLPNLGVQRMFLSVSRNIRSIDKELIINLEAIVGDGGILDREKKVHYRHRRDLCTGGKSSLVWFKSDVFVL
jgi:hypothetical protein